MKQHITDERTGISYTLQGDYYLPDLKLPKQPKIEIGIWGKRHLRYIKQHHKIRYTNLLTSCKLTAYLAELFLTQVLFIRSINKNQMRSI